VTDCGLCPSVPSRLNLPEDTRCCSTLFMRQPFVLG
jgi:hypothetical protein